ncbi:ferredoxin family protein [Mycetohabitans sp. B46]|uniref:ferredoxin family protein n=1 Tax=Mycetohabitans sp. B46 TaxID=2772536 RepID=UPI00307CEA48
MTHVVTESCIKCHDGPCLQVCPVDCFHEGLNFVVTNPYACIDCAVCVAECPGNAIYEEHDVPSDQKHFLQLNEEVAEKWPKITRSVPALPDAEKWKDLKGKLKLLD